MLATLHLLAQHGGGRPDGGGAFENAGGAALDDGDMLQLAERVGPSWQRAQRRLIVLKKPGGGASAPVERPLVQSLQELCDGGARLPHTEEPPFAKLREIQRSTTSRPVLHHHQ